jgi:hypothetical protein
MRYIQLTLKQVSALLKLIDFYFKHRTEIHGSKDWTEMDLSIQAIRNKIVEE